MIVFFNTIGRSGSLHCKRVVGCPLRLTNIYNKSSIKSTTNDTFT